MAIKKKITKQRNRRVGEDGETGAPYAAGRKVKWWRMEQPSWRSLQFLKKWKAGLALAHHLYS